MQPWIKSRIAKMTTKVANGYVKTRPTPKILGSFTDR